MTSESLEPAAYRVKDFADGWILCQTAAEAKRYSAAGHLVEPLYAAPPQGAGGDVGKLRRALEDTHCALVAVVAAMKREPAMQHRRFDGLGIQAHDAINKAAQALATPSSEGDGKAKAPVTSEELAQFLHDEFDEPEKLTGGVWPLDDNDDGYRGDGAYVRLQPKYVVERYRDAGRRLAAWLARRATPSQVSPAIGGDYSSLPPTSVEGEGL